MEPWTYPYESFHHIDPWSWRDEIPWKGSLERVNITNRDWQEFLARHR